MAQRGGRVDEKAPDGCKVQDDNTDFCELADRRAYRDAPMGETGVKEERYLCGCRWSILLIDVVI